MISGVVRDAEGVPIPYVNVLFSGTVIGTITNDAGEFVLSSDASHEELNVSLLGYSSQKLDLTRKRNRNIVITLEEGEQLNEVVVVLKPKKRLRKKENPCLRYSQTNLGQKTKKWDPFLCSPRIPKIHFI